MELRIRVVMSVILVVLMLISSDFCVLWMMWL